MLQPRESDIPALFIFLVVIPLFIYIVLGRCSETSKKKARISALAHLAAEEAFQVEAMASADVLPVLPSKTGVDVFPVLPSSRIGFHKCARCSCPATTRCSRCKSVRYWYLYKPSIHVLFFLLFFPHLLVPVFYSNFSFYHCIVADVTSFSSSKEAKKCHCQML